MNGGVFLGKFIRISEHTRQHRFVDSRNREIERKRDEERERGQARKITERKTFQLNLIEINFDVGSSESHTHGRFEMRNSFQLPNNQLVSFMGEAHISIVNQLIEIRCENGSEAFEATLNKIGIQSSIPVKLSTKRKGYTNCQCSLANANCEFESKIWMTAFNVHHGNASFHSRNKKQPENRIKDHREQINCNLKQITTS